MIKLTLILLLLLQTLYSEDFGSVNSNYKQVRIKSKAKKHSSNSRICNVYIEIDGNNDWNEHKNKLHEDINECSPKTKKYVIYKIIKNVNTDWRRTSANNSSDCEFDINLGIFVDQNSDIDIEIHTVVKNSTLKDGYSKQKTNTGVVTKSSSGYGNFTDGAEYKSNTIIQNSEVGNNGFVEEIGMDMAKDFLQNDSDNPLN
ncbi:MAG: hypothetical protein U9P71_02635 [Campylobacterota bacterium]|nr:hypothetical protein [Campylobacterota bacterium]